MADPYSILGVKAGADHAQIRKAYLKLARRHHPDTKPGATAAEAATLMRWMAAVNAAWEILGDPERRAAYDADNGVGVDSGGRAPNWPTNPPGAYRPYHAGRAPGGADTAFNGLGVDEVADLHRRPSDELIMLPVIAVIVGIALFVLSLVMQSELLVSAALAMIPLAGLGFVIAPLMAMRRGRR